MAKKTTTAETPRQLALRVLAEAALDPASKLLFGTKAVPGIFGSNTEATRQAMQVAVSEGWLEETGEVQGKGKTAKNLFRVSPAGKRAIQENTPTIEALRTLNAVAERQLREIESAAATFRALDAGVRSVVDFVRQTMKQKLELPEPASPAEGNLGSEVIRQLAGISRREPLALPDLYRRLTANNPGLTLGRFHDCVSELWDARRIELLPYTRAFAEIARQREPVFLDGEVMYYAYSTT